MRSQAQGLERNVVITQWEEGRVWIASAVRLFLQRGAFAKANTVVVASVQRLALFQLPSYLLAAPIIRLISALKANHQLLRAAALHLSVNAIDYTLMRRMGGAGIGLATSITAALYLCYLAVVLSMQLSANNPHRDLKEMNSRPDSRFMRRGASLP